ncbi:carbohydrate-binding module family 13 protein [Backusella circina FSU 941]|nr:carbohydrate-binding module family 13 protein [Backusella circina FSU 941]
MSMFPEGYFYILSRKHGFALDVYDGQTKEDANIIVWPQKFQDSENQLWSYTGNRLENKKSGHVLDISSSAFRKDKTIVQKKRKPNKQAQEWIYDKGFICCKEYPSLVLDIRGDSPKGGAQVLLYKRKETDNMNQQWQFEPYHQFKDALEMATTTVPLHKKEGFGQPRPGYAAEVGVPPELTKIPENNKIAGVGKNVDNTPTPTTNAPPRPDGKKPEALNQYGSFYDYPTQTAPPPPQPGQAPSSNAYPPPPPPSGSGVYPPQPGPVPISSNAYPPSSQPSGGQGTTYPPLPPNHPAGAYNNSGFTASPPSSGGFPSPPNYQQPAAGFPQPPSSNSSSYPGSPPQPSGYPAPPLPGNHPSGNYPQNDAYPPPQQSNAYPPPQQNNAYPPPQQNNAYPPPSGGGGFYLPQAPNRQDQYGGYPSYPQ